MTTRRQRTQRLQTMGVLAAGLAHEVKNPLSTMSVNLQLLAEDYADPRTPLEQRTLKRARLLLGEVDRLDRIVNDFLALARGYELSAERVDVELLLTDLLRFIEPENEQLGIAARGSFDPAARDVLADPRFLRLALNNLVVNAQQAMAAEGGELFVETVGHDAVVEIRVTDTGPGIPPDKLEKIWQPFFSTKGGGTGLGLPTTRRIVEELGGEIGVVSELGRGTRFTILLPRPPRELGGETLDASPAEGDGGPDRDPADRDPGAPA